MYNLTIAHLYPEQMNIYGDRGNIITLRQRCAWREITTTLIPVMPGSSIDWQSVDLAFFGGGQDSGQALIAADFVEHQAEPLRRAAETGMVLLAICGGYQLLGHYFLTHTGEKLPGIGLLDVHTVGSTQRLIGNLLIEANWGTGRQTLVGFENHSGGTFLGKGVKPLGKVLAGHGNNGQDGSEGAVWQNVIGCYMHGSLLPKNPHFADHLLELALQRRHGASATLSPLDDQLELAAHNTMVERLQH
ncbi:glutamine amidotransferase [Herpetosiphon gulosus]|uniref:Lipid II isoglutaminyl synthase (glutamine-hydrolyzing) subunit GatD n=1 Tax=Herpetosiphon gulosus TaxID=1973496 RepID=A0ABP9WVV4_9CHLR